MLSDQEFQELQERVATGREWINMNGGWAGNNTPAFDHRRHTPVTRLQKAIRKWFLLSEECFKEIQDRKMFDSPKEEKHSRAWHDMKFQVAFEKWKHTPKIRRGTDPRLLSRESFV